MVYYMFYAFNIALTVVDLILHGIGIKVVYTFSKLFWDFVV